MLEEWKTEVSDLKFVPNNAGLMALIKCIYKFNINLIKTNIKQKVITAKHYSAESTKIIHHIHLTKPCKTLVFVGCGQLVFFSRL